MLKTFNKKKKLIKIITNTNILLVLEEIINLSTDEIIKTNEKINTLEILSTKTPMDEKKIIETAPIAKILLKKIICFWSRK